MSLIPAFTIGVWNAWILMVWLLISLFLGPLNIIPKGREEGNDFTTKFNKMQKSALISGHIIYLLLVIYSIFVPLKLGIVWFYAGLSIYLLGLIANAMVFVGFATTPPDELIIKEIYRYSRHPMYLAQFLVFLGVGMATASWVFLLFSVVFLITPLLWIDAEERHCLKFYGDSYREYMNRTPRWIGIPKSEAK
ncbi:methyltransferase family protein [Chloroflexota bacterium]